MPLRRRSSATLRSTSVKYSDLDSDIVDVDLSSVSATDDTIASAKAIKTYVDAASGGTVSDLSDTTITSPTDAALLLYDTGTSTWRDATLSGDATITDTGVISIASGVIIDADVNASAAIAISKTALVAGTGITLATNTLNIDAAQTQITSVGALDGGSITSGFGAIDTGSSTITTTGLISGGSLDIDNVLINGTTIGHTDDTDLITLADGVVTVAGEISVTTLDIGGTNVTSTAAELNLLDGVSGLVQADFTKLAAIDSTAAEINLLDALDRGSILYGNASGATAVLGQGSANQILTSDGTDIAWQDAASVSTLPITANNSTDETVYPVFVDGATGSQGLESDTGLTYNPSSGILTATQFTGAVSGNATTATTLANARTIGGTSFDGSANIAVALAGTATTLATARTIGGVSFDGSANINLPGVNATGDQDTSGNATTATTATTATNVTSSANNSTDETVYPTFVDGATGAQGIETDTGLTYNPSSGILTATQFTGALSGNSTTATTLATARTIGGTSFDGSANIAVALAATATTLATARTIGGVSFDGSANINLPGVNAAGNQNTSGTATNATNVTVSDNESTNEDNLLTFVAGAATSTGNHGLEMDGNLIYNPSTGRLTATQLAGTLQTAAQTNITSVGALNAGSITSGFGSIDVGSSAITTTGTLTAGNLTVNGTTTTVNSTVVTIDDPIFTLGGDSAPGSDDNKDRGIEFRWHNGSAAKVGFFGYDDSAGKFTFIPDATNSSEVFSGTAGTIVANLEGNVTGDVTGNTSGSSGSTTGNAATATALATARTIGGTSFDGTANIAVALSATSTALASARTIGGVSFDGTANINLPGVNASGTQDTSGTAALATSITATANNTADETVYLTFVDGVSGSQGIETDSGLTYNPSTGVLTATTFTGAVSGTVTDAAHVTITDNESTNENNLIPFVEDAASSTGNHGLEMDGDFHYNPSTGAVTATTFVGNLTGNVTGNTSGTSGSTTGNAATATALATARTIGGTSFDGSANIAVALAATATTLATARDIGGVSFDGSANINLPGVNASGTQDTSGNAATATALATARTIGGTSFDGSANIAVALSATATALANARTIGGVSFDGTANINLPGVNATGDQDTSGNASTAPTATTATNVTASANNSTDETVYPTFIDGATGSQGIETDTGFTYNPSSGLLTITGELDAGSLDISGDADIDGTLEADAITVDGTALNEYIADTVGAMVNSNTESGITVAYQDGDNTLDFTVGTLNQDTTGNAATATALETARTIGGTSFDGSANIAVALSATATTLANARTIGGTSFDGSANIVPATITVADTTDTTSFVALFESATGDLAPKTDAGITYNAGTGMLTATGFTGPITGNASTATALASGRTIGMTGDVVWTSASFDGSGNVTGSAVIQATSVENSMLAGSIADSKLNTITTADKVSGAAVQVDGATDGTGITIVDADKFLVDDAGTSKYVNASQIKSYIGDAASEGFAIAMSVAL